jgi:hypothetical protein
LKRASVAPTAAACGSVKFETMKSRQASAASTSTSALAAASRAPWTASLGRSSVLDGMQAPVRALAADQLALAERET